MSVVTYGTRWGRAGFFAGTALVAVGAMGFGMTSGAFGASYLATGVPGTLTADGLTTEHVAAITRPMQVKATDGSIYTKYVATFLIGKGSANGICITEKVSLLGQTFTILINAGDEDPSTDEIQLDGLALNVFSADAFLQALGTTYVGKNPLDIVIEGVPSAPGTGPGEFGLEADGVVLKHAVASHQDGEIVRLPPGVALDAKILAGDHDCPNAG